MSKKTYLGADGLYHYDPYGDNTSYHRVGGTYRMSPWWFNRDDSKKKKAKRKAAKKHL